MIFWIDAQLPPDLSRWLQQKFSIEAHALRDLGFRDAPDQEIFAAARKAGTAVITKDSDFVELVYRMWYPTTDSVGNMR